MVEGPAQRRGRIERIAGDEQNPSVHAVRGGVGVGKVGKALGAKTTPHIFVINKGKLAYAGALHDDQFGKKPESEVRTYVDDALNAVLAGKDVPLAETTPWGCGVKYKDADKAKHTGHGPEKPVEKP